MEKPAATPLGNPEFMTHDAMLRGGDRPPGVKVTRNIASVATKTSHLLF